MQKFFVNTNFTTILDTDWLSGCDQVPSLRYIVLFFVFSISYFKIVIMYYFTLCATTCI